MRTFQSDDSIYLLLMILARRASLYLIFGPFPHTTLSTKKDVQLESCELSFMWGKMRTVAQETAPQIAMRDCSKETELLVVLSHFGHVQLCATLWTVACQAPLSIGFSRQECWSGFPFPPPGGSSNTEIEPLSHVSTLAGGFFTTSATWQCSWQVPICSWQLQYTSIYKCESQNNSEWKGKNGRHTHHCIVATLKFLWVDLWSLHQTMQEILAQVWFSTLGRPICSFELQGLWISSCLLFSLAISEVAAWKYVLLENWPVFVSWFLKIPIDIL